MKVLILKKNDNNFELEFSNAMKTKDIDVYEPLKKTNKLNHYLRAIHKRLKINFGFSIWLNEWKRSIKRYNYIIHFDNDVTLETIKWISKHNKTSKQLLWLWNIPSFDINEYKKYCKVACFDATFAKKHDIYYLKQFFCDKIINGLESNENEKSNNGIVYIGYDKDRFNILRNLATRFEASGLSYNFILKRSSNSPQKSKDGIVFINDDLDYRQVLMMEKYSDAILELNKQGQEGVTLRALEAMFFKKKLITNNKKICNCDFYDSSNIFILGVDKNLNRFISEPYNAIDKEIINEYKYESWIDEVKNILDK